MNKRFLLKKNYLLLLLLLLLSLLLLFYFYISTVHFYPFPITALKASCGSVYQTSWEEEIVTWPVLNIFIGQVSHLGVLKPHTEMFHLNDSQCYPLFVRNVNWRSFMFFSSRHRRWLQIGGSRDGEFLFLILVVDVYLHRWGHLWFILVQGYTWFSLTWWAGLAGVQNNGNMQLKFCITIESNS